MANFAMVAFIICLIIFIMALLYVVLVRCKKQPLPPLPIYWTPVDAPEGSFNKFTTPMRCSNGKLFVRNAYYGQPDRTCGGDVTQTLQQLVQNQSSYAFDKNFNTLFTDKCPGKYKNLTFDWSCQ